MESIGDANGRIAFYMDETTAIDLAYLYGPSDGFFDEIMRAVERAYPKPDPDEEVLGVEVGLRPNEHGRLVPSMNVTLRKRGDT